MTAEILFLEDVRVLSDNEDITDAIEEVDYKSRALTEEELAAPGGFYGYVNHKSGTPIGAFVRIGFAQPCSQEERLDAARALFHLKLLQRSYA